MSAYLVSHDHIDFLATAISVRARDLHCPKAALALRQDGAGFATMLLDANIASMQSRYSHNSSIPAEIAHWRQSYTRFINHPGAIRATPAAIISAIHCFEYQACEFAEWEESSIRHILRALRDDCVQTLIESDATAKWGAPENELRADAFEPVRVYQQARDALASVLADRPNDAAAIMKATQAMVEAFKAIDGKDAAAVVPVSAMPDATQAAAAQAKLDATRRTVRTMLAASAPSLPIRDAVGSNPTLLPKIPAKASKRAATGQTDAAPSSDTSDDDGPF